MRLASQLLLAFLATAGCASDSDEGAQSQRCAALCDPESCEGESRELCVDECVAQTEDLPSTCTKCLVDRSELTVRRELGGGEYCYRLVSPPWGICDEDGLNCRPGGEICDDETLPQSCSLRLASLSDCTEFCGE